MNINTIVLAKCKPGTPDMLDELDNTNGRDNKTYYAVGEKYDGYRMLLDITKDGTRIFSRTKKEYTNHVPHITIPYPELAGTILDCEAIAPTYKHSDTTSIFGSLPSRAVEVQNKIGKAHLCIFDVLQFKGEDVRRFSQAIRSDIVHDAACTIRDDYNYGVISVLSSETLFEKNLRSHYDDTVGAGREGVVLKDMNATYGEGWTKIKQSKTYDFIIIGFTKGKGKHINRIGAIEYGGYNKYGIIEYVGKASGMSDAVREDMTYNPKLYLDKVVELSAFEVTTSGALRFPQFVRMRDDKPLMECVVLYDE